MDVGLLLLQLREAIVSGELTPPWPVVANPVPNYVAALQADAARANRPLSAEDRETLQCWEDLLVMPTKLTRERFRAMQEISRLRSALAQAETKFREEANRYRRNRDNLRERLDGLWQQFETGSTPTVDQQRRPEP